MDPVEPLFLKERRAPGNRILQADFTEVLGNPILQAGFTDRTFDHERWFENEGPGDRQP
jgi:hypothetical protein